MAASFQTRVTDGAVQSAKGDEGSEFQSVVESDDTEDLTAVNRRRNNSLL